MTSVATDGADESTDALRCALAGIAAVDPYELVEHALTAHNFGPNVALVAAGKAAGAMASAAADVLGPYLRRGIVIAPERVVVQGGRAPVVCHAGGHPVPNEAGARAAASVYRLVESLERQETLLCLISGGASALMTLPPEDVSLADVGELTRLLLRSGANIDELNCVRKHLDRLKGGRLSALAFPSRVVALILSDVVGDSLATVASGPTVPDPTTIDDAIAILHGRGVWGSAPETVRAHLVRGNDESPKPADLRFTHSTSLIVGNNSTAADAARACAESLGYNARVVTTAMTGEACEVGARIATLARDERDRLRVPVALIFAGETTVTVRGNGIGGRNQELALGAAIELDGTSGITVAAVGTDGIDGPTDAAGAIANGSTIARAKTLGLDPNAALAANDSHAFWTTLGDLVITGPTGTNVMDLVVATAFW